MSYDPVAATREFHEGYCVAPIDPDGDRAAAVTTVTRHTARVSTYSENTVGALWSLLTDLEAAASNEVLEMDLEMAADHVAQALAVLYELANVLGLPRVTERMAQVHEHRMHTLQLLAAEPHAMQSPR